MTRRRATLAAAALAAGLASAGCPRTAPPPDLAGTWPADPPPYQQVVDTWTRGDEIRRDYQLVAEVYATLKSPEWRAAWVERRVAAGDLSPAAAAELLAEQRAAHEEAVEIELILTTWDRRENDLDRGERSVWRITLVDAAGNEIAPTEVSRDRRPEQVIRTEFPEFGDFSRAYILKFPRDAKVFGPDVGRVRLKLSSTRGGVDLTWVDPGARDPAASR